MNAARKSADASVVVHLPNRRTPQQFAAIIREREESAVKTIFDTAVMVETAHAELGPAQWLVMVKEELRWSRSKGFALLKIAQCGHFAEVHHDGLPADWNTLISLTSLTAEQFQTGIDTGVIHAGMRRKDVASLKPPKEKKEVVPRPPRPSAISPHDFCLIEVRRRCFETVQEIPADQLAAFFDDIEAEIADLKAKTLGN
jgi:hypothetical protein